MKYPRNKKNSRGVSIIEIVVAMILLMTTKVLPKTVLKILGIIHL